MSETIDPSLASRHLILLPHAWYWRAGFSLFGIEEATPGLRFHARANWLTGVNCFRNQTLDDILFEFRLLPIQGEPGRCVRDGLERSYGMLRFYDSEQGQEPFVSGHLRVPAAVHDHLAERLSRDLSMPSQVAIGCHGLELDISPAGHDLWNTATKPALDIVSAEFTYERKAYARA